MCAVDWTGFSLDAELFPDLDETGIAIVIGIALLRRWYKIDWLAIASIGYHYDLLYVWSLYCTMYNST